MRRCAPGSLRAAAAFALLIGTSPPAIAGNDPRLVGRWHGSTRGAPLELQMNADGTGLYQGQPIKWNLQYGQLIVNRDGETDVYAMKVEGDTLVVAGGEYASLFVLTREADDVTSDPKP